MIRYAAMPTKAMPVSRASVINNEDNVILTIVPQLVSLP